MIGIWRVKFLHVTQLWLWSEMRHSTFVSVGISFTVLYDVSSCQFAFFFLLLLLFLLRRGTFFFCNKETQAAQESRSMRWLKSESIPDDGQIMRNKLCDLFFMQRNQQGFIIISDSVYFFCLSFCYNTKNWIVESCLYDIYLMSF